jgi:hypothetical protein
LQFIELIQQFSQLKTTKDLSLQSFADTTNGGCEVGWHN